MCIRDRLKADAVLVNKLKSLSNVTIHTNAQTTEITGADGKVNGLKYKDRATNVEHTVQLEGVFVQIGLVPNTEWLKGTVELSRFGEIIVDSHGRTNIPGVFAAGDCTTVPFKQKTAYEISACLVGSEMCIRDSWCGWSRWTGS